MEAKIPSSGKEPRRKVFRHVKPIFVTLKEGAKIVGQYLGEQKSQFGPVYK